jgi:hypothetical protein
VLLNAPAPMKVKASLAAVPEIASICWRLISSPLEKSWIVSRAVGVESATER